MLSRGGSAFPGPHKQVPHRVHSSGHPAGTSWRGACQLNVWTVVGVLAFCSVAVYALHLTRRPFSSAVQKASNPRFWTIIDAGSSGSRLYVFKYVYDGKLPRIDWEESVSKKVTPGLLSFAENPEDAGPLLVELVDFSHDKVPVEEWQSTRVYLMATAGLRSVEEPIRDRILESCRAVLRGSGFRFKDEWASVISATDEGKFVWVAANYALGTLGNEPRDTVGIVEIGGASAQVTFVPVPPSTKEHVEKVVLGGVTYSLYIHSFLQLGQEAAWKELSHLLYSAAVRASSPAAENGIVVDTCTPKGYHRTAEAVAGEASIAPILSTILSSGDFAKCRKAALHLLEQGKDSCQHTQCAVGSHFVPELRRKVFGTENFLYTSQFSGLPSNATLSEIEAAGVHYCESDWSTLQQQHSHILKDDLLKYCFSSSYIVALFNDSLDIMIRDERMKFTNQVGNIALNWALGAFVVQMGEILQQRPVGLVRDDAVTILSLMGSACILVLVLWFIMRWRRPHVKTIYDLEKGRYITTAARLHR